MHIFTVKSGVTLSEANNNSVTSYTYDDFGRVQIQTTNNLPVYYSYDLNDNVTSVMLSGETTSYTYDRLNRMTSVVDGNISTQYTYNNLGNRTLTTTSVNGATASQTTYVYNLAGLATSLVNRNGEGEILSSFSYTYSADGNILSETDHLGVTTTYTYDLLGRLISEVGAHSSYYSYDISGNRTQVVVDTATVISYNYNANGELVSETSNNGSVSETTAYEYDLNGNLTKKTKGFSVTDYSYNAWNQMVSAGNVTYTYNAQGLRISKTVGYNTETFVLSGDNVLADGQTIYVRGIELISNRTQLYLYNIRGDVIQLLGFDGEVDKTYDYDAYGNEYSRDISDENPFRYCGEYYDTETGFIYLRARYYDPTVGRFTTVDPIKDGLNWYSYCDGNPVSRVDRNGLFWDIIFDVVSLGFSIYDVIQNPDSVMAWLGLAGDVADLLLFGVGGIGEAIKLAYKGGDLAKAAIKLVDAKNYKKAGAWLLGAFERGYELERKLGGMCNNFPIIDKFVESASIGLKKTLSSITSIKSMDITAKTYQNANKMYKTLKKYVDDLASFVQKRYKGFDYILEEGGEKILELALPPVKLLSEQAEALESVIKYASEKGIKIIIQIIE